MLPLSDGGLEPGAKLGQYTIEGPIGVGGMGTVYRARHQGLQKTVALKVLHPALVVSHVASERFLREGEAIARIRHPNVVDVMDIGVFEGVPYLVMELLKGETLASYLARNGRLPDREVASALIPIADALEASHRAGVIHRDIKPDNVFLAWLGGRVVPKIVDFGISKMLETPSQARLTGNGVLGTPAYMAPEQILRSRPVDARSDQYGFGVMLYECATGAHPFERPSSLETMSAVVSGDVVRPRQLRPEISETLERIILRAIATTMEDRYPSMRELGSDLLPLASSRVRHAHGPSFGVVSDSEPPPPVSRPASESPPSGLSTLEEPSGVVVLHPRNTAELERAVTLDASEGPPLRVTKRKVLSVALLAGMCLLGAPGYDGVQSDLTPRALDKPAIARELEHPVSAEPAQDAVAADEAEVVELDAVSFSPATAADRARRVRRRSVAREAAPPVVTAPVVDDIHFTR